MQPHQGCRFVFVCVPLALASGVDARGIAVTEFLSNPNAVEPTEWVELFNYGSMDIDLTGWTIADEAGNSADLPGIVLPSGGYLVVTRDEAQFLAEWFSGTPNDFVYGLPSGFALNNLTDQIILRNASSEIVWNLAYINDETSGFATFLTGGDFSITDFGTAAAPGISRSGDDLGLPGFLGYQQNNFTIDPFAFTSVSGDLGSPLAGSYGTIPAPGGLCLLALWGVSMTKVRRRRSCTAPGSKR